MAPLKLTMTFTLLTVAVYHRLLWSVLSLVALHYTVSQDISNNLIPEVDVNLQNILSSRNNLVSSKKLQQEVSVIRFSGFVVSVKHILLDFDNL